MTSWPLRPNGLGTICVTSCGICGRGQHAMGLGGVHAQAGFGQDVLAGVQGGQRDGTVQVRPGADHHGVDVGVGDQVFPALEGARDAELAGPRQSSMPAGDCRRRPAARPAGPANRECAAAGWRRPRSGRREAWSWHGDYPRRVRGGCTSPFAPRKDSFAERKASSACRLSLRERMSFRGAKGDVGCRLSLRERTFFRSAKGDMQLM